MNKKELVKEVSKKTGFTLAESNNAINALLETITESLRSGESVYIRHFGSFLVKERKARRSMNINTKKIMTIPAKKVVKFNSKV